MRRKNNLNMISALRVPMKVVNDYQNDILVNYNVRYRRKGTREDPWVSMGDHPDNVVYGGQYDPDPDAHGDLLKDGGGMNVYIRTLPEASSFPPQRKLLELSWRDLADKVTLRYFPPGWDYSNAKTAWYKGEDILCTVDPKRSGH